MRPFNADQSRLLIDAAQHYDQWLASQRELARYHGWMTWKTAKGNEYLYHGNGNGGTSLGRRSAETEAQYEAFTQGKAEAQRNLDTIETRLKERAPMLLSVQLGKLAFELARVLRSYDTHYMLGPCLMVGGTHAILAYEILAGQQLDSELAATEDLDFLWLLKEGKLDNTLSSNKPELVITGGEPDNSATPDYKLLKHLKDIDNTFTVNTERTFQARNAKGFAIDFLATSVSQNTIPSERLKPLRIKGQSWLLLYPPIESIVIDSKGLPCKLICPDPRLYAIHKHWVSQREDREKLKIARDRKQAEAVAKLTAAHLPQFPFNKTFIDSLPEELQTVWRINIAPLVEHVKFDSTELKM